ncbi:MAG: LemA family protein [Candidatus Omnitrophica bacterium]|nr:LemA family protein [Candidatus Omnitrophota bacterium]
MKKILLILLGVVILFGFMFAGSYNGLVTLQEGVKEKWAQVENVYQRRLDLIPNLISTVKGYANHEKETLNSVVEARSKAMQTKLDVGALTDNAKFEAFSKAQNQLSSVLSRLMVVVERYPDLKANQNFLALQSQLEGSENRITVERKRFNEAVRAFNTKIQRFPTNMLAGMFGFEKVNYFESVPEAATVPKVEF